MGAKEEFIDIYQTHIKREGATELLKFLKSEQSDFFAAPASTRFHLAYEGGLVEHSVNVYRQLVSYVSRPDLKPYFADKFTDESLAIVALLHDVCKINVYKKSFRNVKDDSGKWNQVPSFDYQDDLPYGHGEKSVYILSGFLKLTREEAFAIRYHMGFSNTEEKNNVSSAFEKFPLAFCLSTADMEATFLVEAR